MSIKFKLIYNHNMKGVKTNVESLHEQSDPELNRISYHTDLPVLLNNTPTEKSEPLPDSSDEVQKTQDG